MRGTEDTAPATICVPSCGHARWSVRCQASSNFANGCCRSVASLPPRPVGSLHPFGLGISHSRRPYLPHYRAAFAFSDSPLPPPSSPFLTVGIPPCGGTSGAYPVVQCGEADGEAAPSSPAGHDATVVDGSNRRADPHAIFGSGLSAPLAGSRSRTLTMDVHLRSAFHPLLGRVRIGASRVRPLSPELHTLDCSVACPGSSTWVDKVPSRDTPSLNLADHRGGVGPLGDPQVARSRSSSRRQRPSRVQRANSPYSVPRGISKSCPMARHCMPQKPTHQIAMTAL